MYEPLAFVKKCMDGLDPKYDSMTELAFSYIFDDYQNVPDKLADLFIEFILSDAFLSKDVEVPDIKAFNLRLLDRTDNLKEVLGLSEEDLGKNKLSLKTEWRDILLAPILFDRWAHHKQVYKLDGDFAKALIYTEKIQLTRGMVEHLPFRSFYLDMSGLKLPDIHGGYITIFPFMNVFTVCVYLLTYDNIYFSHYLTFMYDKDNNVKITSEDLLEAKPVVLPGMVSYNKDCKMEYEFSRRELITLVLQFLAYVSSKDPQVAESEQTKHTYKPNKSGRVKNKWSEVQMFDVGYVFGASFRKKLAKAREETGGDVEMLSSAQEKAQQSHKSHKSPKPHIRCAHWHRYRYGENHSMLSEPVWMEPIFVGFGDVKKEMPLATIHKVKN